MVRWRIETKFTALGGQDPEDLPYDVIAPLEEQFRQSVRVSLGNLQVSTKSQEWRPLNNAPPLPSVGSQRRIGIEEICLCQCEADVPANSSDSCG